MRGSLAGMEVAKGLNFKHKKKGQDHLNAKNDSGKANASKSNKTKDGVQLTHDTNYTGCLIRPNLQCGKKKHAWPFEKCVNSRSW